MNIVSGPSLTKLLLEECFGVLVRCSGTAPYTEPLLRLLSLASREHHANFQRELAGRMPLRVLSFDIGEYNMACCELVESLCSDTPIHILHWEVIDLSGGTRTQQAVQTVCARLPAMILARPWMRWASHVAIELQPQHNTRMRILSYALHTAFVTLATVEGNRPLSSTFVHATKKLKVVPDIGDPRERSYKDRKKLAQKHCLQLLERMGDRYHYAMFTELAKADDLADCFLQGIAWLREQREQLERVRQRRAGKTSRKRKVSMSE